MQYAVAVYDIYSWTKRPMGRTTLVLHPLDKTTRFLERTYRGVDATILTGRVSRERIRGLMEKFDQIIMLGHGSSDGLYSVGRFPSCQYVIDAQFVDQLRERENNVFIWCFASDFARNNRLRGFATGMFISETNEAKWFKLTATEAEIHESNNQFANVVGRFANQHPRVLYAAVDQEYGKLADFNPVAEYNHARIELFEGGGCGNEILRPRKESVNVRGVAGAHPATVSRY